MKLRVESQEDVAAQLETLAADIRAGRVTVETAHAEESNTYALGPSLIASGRAGQLRMAWVRPLPPEARP